MTTAMVTPPPSFASGSLYVGDLNPEVTEAQLFEVFKKVGPVASIRVCRDAVTRRSLGYAYVNFHNYADAERALDLLNYKDLMGRQLRIMWSQRDPSLRKSGSGNIFIKNLDKNVDNKSLYDTFSTFGNILSCKVSTDENGASRGFGFVHYDNRESAVQAISKTNGHSINGKQCFVGEFVSRKDRMSSVEPKWTNVFVKNLDKDKISEEGLKKLFSPFGAITSVYLAKDEQGKSKGFGFINFEKHESAQRAQNEMNNKTIEGAELYVSRAQKKAERERELRSTFERLKRERMSKYQGVNLYIKNLDDSINDDRLREEFAQFGTITSAKVMTDDKAQSKGFGFVCFSTSEEATKAVTEMNGKMIVNKPIYVTIAQRKEQRRAQLEAQYAQRTAAYRSMQPGVNVFPPPMFYPSRPGFLVPSVLPRGGRYPNPGRGFVPPFAGLPRTRAVPRGKLGRGDGPGYPTVKFHSNVRNSAQPPVPEQIQAPAPINDKQAFGEEIYMQLTKHLKQLGQDESLAGKITGMFLESMSPQELTDLTTNVSSMTRNLKEALNILQVHGIIKK